MIKKFGLILHHLKSNFYSYYFFLGHLRCETKCFFFAPHPKKKLELDNRKSSSSIENHEVTLSLIPWEARGILYPGSRSFP